VNLFGPDRIREVQLRFGKSALVGAKWRGLPVHFRDTVRHIPASVKELGNLVGLEKVNLRMRRDKMRDRCLRDAAITYRTARRIAEVYARFKEAPRLTLASTAYHIWQKRYFRERVVSPSREIWHDALEAYHGGRTEAFALGHFRSITVIDVASMFPWAMVSGRFPLPWGPFTREGAGAEPQANGIYSARIEVPDSTRPSLPVRTDDGTVYPVGRFSGKYVGAELIHARACGARVEIIGGTRFLRERDPFKAYVRAMFSRKSRAKGVMRTTYKLLLNSLYGKFGQRGERVECVPAEKLFDMENKPERFRIWNGLAFFTRQAPPPPWGNNVWAAIVTARARVRLHQEIVRLDRAGCRVLYCDTDSVMFEGKGPRYPVRAPRIGAFELRGEYRELFVVGKKEYGLRDAAGKWEPHVKGVPREVRLKYLRTGAAEFKRPVKMREAASRKIEANVWSTYRKIRGKLNKGRTRLPSGALAPVKLGED